MSPSHGCDRAWRRQAALLACAALLAACGGGADADATEMAEEGWFILDDFEPGSIVLSTTEPVQPAQMSLAEAEARLPFAIGLPAAAPEGFTLLDEVEVVAQETAGSGDYASVTLTWENAAGDQVQLQISTSAAGSPAVGAAGSGQAVTVNGDPARLVETRGLGPDRLTLTWSRGGLDYRLSAAGGVVSAEQLIAMAESIA